MPTSNRSPDKASNRSPEKKMDTGAPSSATFNPPSALPEKSATTVKSGYSSAEKVLDVLRHAQDELEKRVQEAEGGKAEDGKAEGEAQPDDESSSMPTRSSGRSPRSF